MKKHVHRKFERTAQEAARLRSMRERYQRDKPTPEQLLTEGGHERFVRLGDFIALQQLLKELKEERLRQKLTIARLSSKTEIDQAALSRLEGGKNLNPTVETIARIARALGKTVNFTIHDAPRPESPARKRKLTKA